jgi:hypothetical protein
LRRAAESALGAKKRNFLTYPIAFDRNNKTYSNERAKSPKGDGAKPRVYSFRAKTARLPKAGSINAFG